MHLRFRLLVAVVLSALLNLTWADPTPAEQQKIEALIAKVEALTDAVFIRNGSDYDAKSAAKFLRGKLGLNKSEIATAQDFIAKAGTGSSTSGKPYLIRFKDGREVACADYLKAELARLEGSAGK
jgi:hypothetical protein